MNIPAPSIEYGALSPMLIVLGAAVTGVLIEAFLPRSIRYCAQFTVTVAGLAASLVAVIALAGHQGSAVVGAVAVDGPTLFLQGGILATGLLAIAPIAQHRLVAFAPQGALSPRSAAERSAAGSGVIQTEVFPLVMFALSGMLLFPAAADLLTMFISLEVLSLPLYVLCGLARRRRVLAQEAALKYFLLGAFSSAFFLYGVALLYGYAGTLSLSGIADAIRTGSGSSTLALTGMALLTVGLLFKVGAVPFHSWVPDVYQGAPTPISGFMSAGTKIAAFGALLRLLYVALPGLIDAWRPVMWGVAVLTMVLGSVLLVTQLNIKRLLAYSSVANVGFMLVGATMPAVGLAPTMFYLLTYGVTTLGAFTVAGLIHNHDDAEDEDITHWSGLGRRSPFLATALALFLLAAAGIPLTSGFVGKFGVLKAAQSSGGTALVLVAVVCSAVAAVAYARVIVTMFFREPSPATPVPARPGPLATTAVVAAAALTVLLGVTPQPLLTLATQAAAFLR
jgi:NADH-quinone oxidoreductase subunit N